MMYRKPERLIALAGQLPDQFAREMLHPRWQAGYCGVVM